MSFPPRQTVPEYATGDLRVDEIRPLIPPAILHEELPLTEEAGRTVMAARTAAARIIRGEDARLLVVVGPCSIHDREAAMEYGRRLRAVSLRLSQRLHVVMRVYFEKPRTTVGWKGLINDPDLDGGFRINHGLRVARGILCDLAELGVPAGCEFLDVITPQYLADLVSWGAIGARTTESQIHRELASGLSMPVGFKNGTEGNVQIAVDAIAAAGRPHRFLGVTRQGIAAIVATRGNDLCHVILRGARTGPNHDPASVAEAAERLRRAGLPGRLMVDCSHGNSRKDPLRQIDLCREIADRVRGGEREILGVMVESHLVAGRQDLDAGGDLVYGQSVTDACLGWDDTVSSLEELAGTR